jgi:hypothetical protein
VRTWTHSLSGRASLVALLGHGRRWGMQQFEYVCSTLVQEQFACSTVGSGAVKQSTSCCAALRCAVQLSEEGSVEEEESPAAPGLSSGGPQKVSRICLALIGRVELAPSVLTLLGH